MKNILAIIKKEFFRFFKDTRLMLTTLVLPGLMIFLVYSLLGDAIFKNFSGDDEYEANVYVEELPDSVKSIIDSSGIKINFITLKENEFDSILSKVQNQDTDLLMIFPKNFDELVMNYDSSSGLKAPNVEMYYNSTNTNSYNTYSQICSVLDMYESTLSNKFDINNSSNIYDLATEKDTTGMIFSMMLPFLILVFLFSGCVAVAPESIAGEKERGTIATLLVTPIKRSELAIGKIISLSCISVLSALSSFIGTIASLPKLMGTAGDLNTNVYSLGDYLSILFVIISTVLVIISIIAILSALAKSVKEASTIISPLMIIVMLIGITSMFGHSSSNSVLYLVPIYNSVQVMSGIFSFTASSANIILTCVSNIIYSVVLVYLLTRVFNNEKIMFSK